MSGRQMAAEMAEQPQALAALAGRRHELIATIKAVLPADLGGIVLVARGSSDHAAVYGRYVLELASGRPVALAAPSLHTLYGATVDYGGYLAVAVSQSGRTPEITTVLRAAQEAGATGIAITNEHDSPLAAAADAVIDLQVGDERAVPATKTFTGQVAAFALLAEALGPVPWGADDWERLPQAVARVLDDAGRHGTWRRRSGMRRAWWSWVADSANGIALEIALKLKETCGLLAHRYSAADLRHGPIGVVERDFPVLALLTAGPTEQDVAELIGQLERRGADVHVARPDGDGELAEGVDHHPPGGAGAAGRPRAGVVARSTRYARGAEQGDADHLMTRLLDDYGPHLARLAGEALVDAVTASEGRVVLAEIMAAAAPPLLRGTANAEVAAALGADLICCNMFDPLDRDAVPPGLEGVEPAASGLTGLRRLLGRPVGLNLEPDIDSVPAAYRATAERVAAAADGGGAFVIVTANPARGAAATRSSRTCR